MTSPFQSSEVAEFSKPEVKEEEQQVKKEINPIEKQVQFLIQPLQQESLTSDALWSFITKYLTFLEHHPRFSNYIEKQYNKSKTKGLINQLIDINGKSFTSIEELLTLILNCNAQNLQSDEQNEFNVLKLNLEAGSVLPFIMNSIQGNQELQVKFLNEMKKYEVNNKNKITEFFSKQYYGINVGYILLIIIILLMLGLGIYYFYFKYNNNVLESYDDNESSDEL
jgi:hypothetical protein